DRSMQLRALALALALAGCSGDTAILFTVGGAGMAPARLEFHIGARDSCGRWAQEVAKTQAEVAGRDLDAAPYRLMISPGVGGAASRVGVGVVALDEGGHAIGEASLGELQSHPGKVLEVGRPLQPVTPAQAWDDPDGACLCRDGLPRMTAMG